MIYPRDENGKSIELNPREWKTEPRPGEPILGPGWPSAVKFLIWMTIVVSVTYYFRGH